MDCFVIVGGGGTCGVPGGCGMGGGTAGGVPGGNDPWPGGMAAGAGVAPFSPGADGSGAGAGGNVTNYDPNIHPTNIGTPELISHATTTGMRGVCQTNQCSRLGGQ